MKTIIEVNPFECRMWALHDRLEGQISEDTCKAEIESFMRHGQLVPVLGRPLHGDPDHKYELIYGARRMFVARCLNKPLLIELRDMSDQEAIVAMDIENRHRLDISPYERGLSYARWLRGGFFGSQDAIARALVISSSQVCRLLKLAHLPSAIVAAFENPADICEGWGVELSNALNDPQQRHRILQRARVIAARTTRPNAREIYQELLCASAAKRRPKATHLDEVVKGKHGEPLFRIGFQTSSVVVKLPRDRVSTGTLAEIRDAISRALQPTREQAPVYPTREVTSEIVVTQ